MKSNWIAVVAVVALLLAGGALFVAFQGGGGSAPPATESATVFTDLSLTGDLSVGDTTTLAGETIFTEATFAPTAGETLNPAAVYYSVDSSAAVSMTLGTTGAVSGQLLFLYGDDANTVTINDTNIKTTDGGAMSLGQFDLAGFIFDGAFWIEMFLAADS